MNVHAVRRSLPSVWEPGRAVEVDELEGGLFLFRFEHQLDVRKVIDKAQGALAFQRCATYCT
ncbi:hypothetical protein LINGRAHAP2_LOCUS32893 [Linum grandiflorum]